MGCLVQCSTMKSTFFGSFWKPNLENGSLTLWTFPWNDRKTAFCMEIWSSRGLPQCPWRGTSQNCGP